MGVLGRRGVLGGAALGLLALSGCDVDDLRPPEDEAGPTTGSTTGSTTGPTTTASPEPDGDARVQ